MYKIMKAMNVDKSTFMAFFAYTYISKFTCKFILLNHILNLKNNNLYQNENLLICLDYNFF